MDAQRSLLHAPLVPMPESDTPQSVLQQGIAAIAQGRYREGIALLVHARDVLLLEHTQYRRLLDTLIQHATAFIQAQEALLSASRTFAIAESELHTSLAHLEQSFAQGEQKALEKPQHAQTLHSIIVQLPLRPKTVPLVPVSLDADRREDDRKGHPYISVSGELPDLSITCFGSFEVRRQQQPVTLCQNRNGQAIFRYLVAQPGYRATVDALMEALWPDEEPTVARRKLQVAISALRCSLNSGYACDPGGGYILCKQHLYLLNPAVRFTTDIAEFLQCYEAGRHAPEDEMVLQYERACRLYTGPLLMEDRYTDWSIGRREQLSQVHLTMCLTLAEQALKHGVYENVISWAHALLAENPCDESAHRLLMLAYVRQGRRNEAMKQYQRCECILFDELGVAPLPETMRLFQSIVTHRAQ